MKYKCEKCDYETDNMRAIGGHRGGHSRQGKTVKEMRAAVAERKRTQVLVPATCECCNRTFKSIAVLNVHRQRMAKPFERMGSDRGRKAVLLRERGQKCEVCNLDSWLDQKIPIEIDHLDGDPDNTAKENYRLICPNCHAQTSTYRGRNIGKVQNSKRKTSMKKYYAKYR